MQFKRLSGWKRGPSCLSLCLTEHKGLAWSQVAQLSTLPSTGMAISGNLSVELKQRI